MGAKTGRQRDWRHGTRKLLDEDCACRVCGKHGVAQRAHIVSRAQGGDDHYDNICPLCLDCHQQFDDGDLDLGLHLSIAEKCHAVALLDRFGECGIEKARRRLYPTAYRDELGRAA